jgi:hypothetical protein
MAAPNIVNITSMIGKTDTTSLTTTSATSILNNPASSNKVFRVTSVRVTNVDGTDSANITVTYYTEDDIGGTAIDMIQAKAVAANTNLDVITTDTPLYLEEDKSLGATASAANDLVVIVTYEEIT